MLRHSADRTSLALVGFTLGLSLLPFVANLGLPALVCLWVVLFFLKTPTLFLHHYHSHLPSFRTRSMNRLYDLALAQCSGYATAEWELQHVRGHHGAFLQPTRDPASTLHPVTGRTMARWEFVLRGTLRLPGDCYRLALSDAARGNRRPLARLVGQQFAQLALTAALLSWNAPIALAFVVAQGLVMRSTVWWGSYWHHADVPRTHEHDGSMTDLDPLYNLITFNGGHHGAHHDQPARHWSRLPERTQELLGRIPADCVRGQPAETDTAAA